jgi:hypothetical protein
MGRRGIFGDNDSCLWIVLIIILILCCCNDDPC